MRRYEYLDERVHFYTPRHTGIFMSMFSYYTMLTLTSVITPMIYRVMGSKSLVYTCMWIQGYVNLVIIDVSLCSSKLYDDNLLILLVSGFVHISGFSP